MNFKWEIFRRVCKPKNTHGNHAVNSCRGLFLPGAGIADTKPEIYLSTTKGAGKISVIIPDFEREGGFADRQGRDRAMADELADDLNFSGFFDAKRVKEVKGDPSAWASLDVNDIVTGAYSTDGRDVTISAKLVDAKAGSVIMNKSYPRSLLVMRENIHRLADEIIFQLTGEKGVCQTKIAFISDMTRHDELYIADYDGHDVFRLTRDSGDMPSPRVVAIGQLHHVHFVQKAEPRPLVGKHVRQKQVQPTIANCYKND